LFIENAATVFGVSGGMNRKLTDLVAALIGVSELVHQEGLGAGRG